MSDTRDRILERVVANDALLEMKKDTQGYNRSLYDDRTKRDQYKARQFEGQQTHNDPYSNNTLYPTKEVAIAESGNTDYTANTDHIVSLERFHERVKNNSLLSNEEKTIIANSDYNFSLMAQKDNTSKQSKSNFEWAMGDESKTVGQKVKIIADGAKADVVMQTDITVRTVKKAVNNLPYSIEHPAQAAALAVRNTGNEFAQGAKNSVEAAAIPLMIEGVHNLILVAKGDKELGEAAKDMGKLTAQVAASGGMIKVVTTGLTNTMKNSGVQAFSKIANSNQVTQIIAVALIVKDSTIRYINGEIDGKQFFEEIGQKGVEMISGSIGFFIGQALIPIPLVGGFIGSFIVSTVCGEIYKACSTLNQFKEREAQVKRIADEALSEMKRQQEVLSAIVNDEYAEWDKRTADGFSSIYTGTLNNDIDMITSGLDNILSIFGKKAAFGSRKEFDDFFDDENAVFVL